MSTEMEMKETPVGVTDQHLEAGTEQHHHNDLDQPSQSKLMRIYAHPWSQILLISFICFCLPGVS